MPIIYCLVCWFASKKQHPTVSMVYVLHSIFTPELQLPRNAVRSEGVEQGVGVDTVHDLQGHHTRELQAHDYSNSLIAEGNAYTAASPYPHLLHVQ